MNPILIGFVIYLLVIFSVGLITYRLNKTQADFLIAGRKLGPWVVSLSERASGESAWLLIGLPGAAFAIGLIEFWTAIGCIAGIIFSWLFIAHGLRRLTGQYDSLTLPDVLATHFGNDHVLRIMSSAIITFFFLFYVAAQFSGAGKVLNVSFGLTELQGMLLGAGIILFYTMMGGFFAVAWTDLIQSLIMFGTLVILPIVGYIEFSQEGQLGPALAGAGAGIASWTGGKAGWGAIAGVIGGLSWGLGYMGQPHLLTRYMAIKDPAKLKQGSIIAISWAIPAFLGSFFMGLVGMIHYGVEAFADPEKLMPTMAMDLLPAWLAGIFISGAIAAMMSTADSQLLVTTSALSEDFYHKALNKEVTPQRLLTLSRLITFGVGIIAFILAYFSTDLVFEMVSYAWAGLGSSFGPVLLLTIYWPKMSRVGAIAGMATGALTTIIWTNVAWLNTAITSRFTSFALALVVCVIASRLFPGSKKQRK